MDLLANAVLLDADPRRSAARLLQTLIIFVAGNEAMRRMKVSPSVSNLASPLRAESRNRPPDRPASPSAGTACERAPGRPLAGIIANARPAKSSVMLASDTNKSLFPPGAGGGQAKVRQWSRESGRARGHHRLAPQPGSSCA